MWNAEEDFYKKGLAVGFCDIRNGTWHYRFRDETFELSHEQGATEQYEKKLPVLPVERVRELSLKRVP